MTTPTFKCCLLGEGRVGKTSLVLRFTRNSFDDSQQSTLDASYSERTLAVGDQTVRLSVWDTAGQERFHSLTPLYYRDAHGALLVFDLTETASFTRAQHWVKELRKMVGSKIAIVIAGNKCDLRGQVVSDSDAQSYADSVGAAYIRTSAKSGEGVQESFVELCNRMIANKAQAASAAAASGASGSSRRAGGGSAGAAQGTSRGGRSGRGAGLVIIDDDDDTPVRPSGSKCC